MALKSFKLSLVNIWVFIFTVELKSVIFYVVFGNHLRYLVSVILEYEISTHQLIKLTTESIYDSYLECVLSCFEYYSLFK